jgi:uncharacterized repeat protein (TIGR01451 family)
MKNWKIYPRAFLFIMLVAGLCAGAVPPRLERVEAKPMAAAAPGDVIISEVAWAGTVASSSAEWIELYNTTGANIDINGWTIIANDGNPSITIPATPIKTIYAGGYFLIECGSDTTVSDITADWVVPTSPTNICAFTNSGEVLKLKEAVTNNVIDTANISGSGWDAGTDSTGTPPYASMERINFTVDNAAAWKSNDGVTRNGKDANGNPINGTPHNSKIDLELKIHLWEINTVSNQVTFHVTVTNKGYGVATNIKVSDPLTGLTYVSHTGPGTFTPGTGEWLVTDSISEGESKTLAITVAMPAGIVTNTATILSFTQSDPSSANNSDSVKIGPSTLDITNDVNNLAPNAGDNVVFTIMVENLNTVDASNVLVDALLPAGFKYISDDVGSAYNSVTGIWTIGPLASTGIKIINITAKVVSCSPDDFIAEVSSTEFANSSSIVSVYPAVCEADLRLAQTWSRLDTAADTAEITLTIYNDGTAYATDVQVKDLLPSGLKYVSYVASSGTYNSSNGIWDIGDIPDYTDAILKITVLPAADGSGTTNFAEVWRSDQYDPDSAPGNGKQGEDDETEAEVLVADLSVTETVNISGSSPFFTAVFTIKITNAGPDDATDVTITNSVLATDYTHVSHSSTTGTYDDISGDWVIPTLLDGATATLIVTTTATNTPENWAQIYGVNEVDPDSLPDNCLGTVLSCREDDDAGGPSADLYLTQVIYSPAPYINSDINSNVVLRITVTNAGYSDATNVTVKDELPVGLTYVAHTTGMTYTNNIWTVGNLASGSSQSLDLTVKVVSYGIKTNWAEVWSSDQSDPDSTPKDGSTADDDDASVTVISYRSVVINEIAWSGTSASVDDEWIELFNPGLTDIPLTGWEIRRNGCSTSVPTGYVYSSADDYIYLNGTIVKSGYFLLERGNFSTDNSTVSDMTANQIYVVSSTVAPTSALSDSGEILYLCDDKGNFVDVANLNGGAWPKGGGSPNYPTMERIAYSSIENDADWVTNTGLTRNGLTANNGIIYGTPGRKNSTGVFPTPTRTPTPSPTATLQPTNTPAPPYKRLVINEFLPRPGYDWNQDGKVDVFDEFIEIKNISAPDKNHATDIQLSEWRLDDMENGGSAPFSLPNRVLRPGERALFFGLETNILLGDGGDTVRLINASGKLYDSYTYSIAKFEDKSVCRLPDGNGSWYEDCSPTPNQTNTREGVVPAMPDKAYESPVCSLPDTLPADFLFAECRGYGANIWRRMFWDATGWNGILIIPDQHNKWDAFLE